MSSVALIVANCEYDAQNNLTGPAKDAEALERLFKQNNYRVWVDKDKNDIRKSVRSFVETINSENRKIDVVHFHYSGHGTDNREVEFDIDTLKASTPHGECLVGCDFTSYAVHQLKSDLAEIRNVKKWIITLDMCRSQYGGARGASSSKLKLKRADPLPEACVGRMAVFYSCYELYGARDQNSFSTELCNLVGNEETKSLPILDIAEQINASWKKKNIRQRCELRLVEEDNTWKNFRWPSSSNREKKSNRIDVTVAAARNKTSFTHFISLPVNAPSIQEAFIKFRREVLENCSDVRGVDETIFQTPTLLHLTLGTMALLDERERDLARNLMQDCKEKVLLPLLGEKPLKFEVSGLEYMNDDPAEVDVLYAKVNDEDGTLQAAADGIVNHFIESGLMTRQYDRVKLHVTLMNTLFRKDAGDLGDKNDQNERESFDSRCIIEGWKDVSLGDVEVNEVHLSQRRAGRRTKEGYYLPSCVVSLVSCG